MHKLLTAFALGTLSQFYKTKWRIHFAACAWHKVCSAWGFRGRAKKQAFLSRKMVCKNRIDTQSETAWVEPYADLVNIREQRSSIGQVQDLGFGIGRAGRNLTALRGPRSTFSLNAKLCTCLFYDMAARTKGKSPRESPSASAAATSIPIWSSVVLSGKSTENRISSNTIFVFVDVLNLDIAKEYLERCAPDILEQFFAKASKIYIYQFLSVLTFFWCSFLFYFWCSLKKYF